MAKMKVVDLHYLYNFDIHDFLSWNHLGVWNLFWACNFQISKFELKNYFQWRNDQHQSCRYLGVIQLWYSSLFIIRGHLVSQNCFNFFQISNFHFFKIVFHFKKFNFQFLVLKKIYIFKIVLYIMIYLHKNLTPANIFIFL